MKLLVAAVTLGICSSAWTEAQTIGDIARQERERQKTVQSTATLTNTPLVSSSETIIGESGPTKVPVITPAQQEKPTGPPKNPIDAARETLKAAEDEVVALQLSLAQARLDYLQKRDIPAQTTRLARSVDQLTKALKAAEKTVLTRREKVKQLEKSAPK